MADSSDWENWGHDAVGLTATPSDFEIATEDEDLVENLSTPEHSLFFTRQLLSFVNQKVQYPSLVETKGEANLKAAAPGTNAIYQPTGPNEIRVFKLAPGNSADPLRASLEHVNVEFDYAADTSGFKRHTLFGLSMKKQKKVPYSAISYCWGKEFPNCPLTISGQPMSITPTLDGILRHLRHDNSTVTLWADQICINQQDQEDKKRQVKMMRLVYARARNTVIWLGPGRGIGAFAALRGLVRATSGQDELLDTELQRLRFPVGEATDHMNVLRTLLHQSWFRRTWIIQEAVLSHNPYVMIGHDTVAWEDFAGDCSQIDGLGIFDDEILDPADVEGTSAYGLAVAADLWLRRSDYITSSGAGSVFGWLVNTRYAGVSEHLDKVYGILGLCDNDIEADYTKPKNQLYCEVATFAMRNAIDDIIRLIAADGQGLQLTRHGVTSILSCVDHDTCPSQSGLPSWVPDWSKQRHTTALAYKTSCLLYYNACGTNHHNTPSLSRTDHMLCVSAKYTDKIVHISDDFVDPVLNLEAPRSDFALLQAITFFNQPRPQNSHSQEYYDGPKFWHCFCSTLVASKDNTGKSNYPEEYIEVLSFLCDVASSRKPTFPGQTYTRRQRQPIGRGGLTPDHFKKGKNGKTFQNLKVAFRNALQHRRLCWTESGNVGLVPRFTRPGDHIYLIAGCVVPFVMRHREGKKYTLVGECYVHTLMDGSFADRAGGHEWKPLVIV